MERPTQFTADDAKAEVVLRGSSQKSTRALGAVCLPLPLPFRAERKTFLKGLNP